jgi:hypothetical protein
MNHFAVDGGKRLLREELIFEADCLAWFNSVRGSEF